MKLFCVLSLAFTILFAEEPSPLSVIVYTRDINEVVQRESLKQFTDFPTIVVVDGPCNKEGAEDVIYCKEKSYCGLALKKVLAQIETPYYYFHDNRLSITKDIDVHGVVQTLKANDGVKFIRLNSRVNQPGKFRDPKLDQADDIVPLCRAFDWVDGDHFGRKDAFETLIAPQLKWPWPIEKFISQYIRFHLKSKPWTHASFGIYVYGNLGDGPYTKPMNNDG